MGYERLVDVCGCIVLVFSGSVFFIVFGVSMFLDVW